MIPAGVCVILVQDQLMLLPSLLYSQDLRWSGGISDDQQSWARAYIWSHHGAIDREGRNLIHSEQRC